MATEEPYITIRADAPLDSRWSAELWFAWSRLLGTCRLKRACTAETWPAAVLRLRVHELASILACHPNKARHRLDALRMVASMTARCEKDHAGDIWTISVDKYAEYQKLGRPTSAVSKGLSLGPPNVPTSQRKNSEGESEPAAPASDATPAELTASDQPKSAADQAPKRAKRPPPTVPPEAALFAEHFGEALARVHPGSKPPTPAAFAGWCQAARLMFDPKADGRTVEDARALAAWLFSDPGGDAAFWRGNVLSVPKFRDKYDQLAAQMRRSQGGRQREATRGSALLAWAHG